MGIIEQAREASQEQSKQAAEYARQRFDENLAKGEQALRNALRERKFSDPDPPYDGPIEQVTGRLRWRVDGVEFVYRMQHAHYEIMVVTRCPHCDEEQADTFYSLTDLGNRLARNEKGEASIGHHCSDGTIARLAREIALAARTHGFTVRDVYDRVGEQLLA